MKKKTSTFFLVLILLIGLSLLLYPTISDYWNSFTQSRAIAGYVEQVSTINKNEYEGIINSAKEYNSLFSEKDKLWVLNEEQTKLYNQQLNVDGNGIMGYVEIPSIDCSLPIYHGTSDSVLQVAIGHIEGSSLPVGGEGTHCVISGHRGLPSAKLFTNLDQLTEGDLFMLYVLDEVLTYEVDQIRIVEPDDLTELTVEEGQDLCTLVTCTPYGVNSHRLLVRGHRVDNVETSTVRVAADAIQMDEMAVALVVAVPILAILLIWLLVHYRKKK